MQEQQRTYIAIDLKSFYASVECVDRGFDPLTTNLVVADVSRTAWLFLLRSKLMASEDVRDCSRWFRECAR